MPANEIVGLLPGELFVHRNEERHIIVCGHYGCSGVRAALHSERHGLIDNWLRHIQDVREKHEKALERLGDAKRTACASST